MSYISNANLIGDIRAIDIIKPEHQVRFLIDTYEEFKKDDKYHKIRNTHSVTVFDKNITRFVSKFIKEGDKVYIDGKLSYTQKNDKFYTNITVSTQYGNVTKIQDAAQKQQSQQPEKNYDDVSRYFT